MTLYNLDLDDVRLLLKLVEQEAERVLAGCEESVGQPTLPVWEARQVRVNALRLRLADEVMHASQSR